MLFSATYPADTSSLCKYALRPNFQMVDAVGKDDKEETNVQASMSPADSMLRDAVGMLDCNCAGRQLSHMYVSLAACVQATDSGCDGNDWQPVKARHDLLLLLRSLLQPCEALRSICRHTLRL